MADPFGRDGVSGGGSDPFGRGAGSTTPHGHFWDAIPGSKIAANTVKDLESAAIHVVPGMYDLGKAVVQDVSHGNLDNTKRIGKAILVSTLHDLEHPLRHPGYTLLDLWGVTSGLGTIGARGAEIGRVARAGGAADDIVKAAIHRAPTPIRYIGGVQSLYSRNPIVRQGQRLTDLAREKYPALGGQNKAGKEGTADLRVNQALDKTLGNKLLAAAKKLTAPEHVALRVAAEGKSIDERIAYHEAQAEGGGMLSRRAHLAQAKLLDRARKYIDDSSGVPVIRPEFKKLQAVYALAAEAAHARTHILREMGFLKDTHRVSAPGQVIEGTFDSSKPVALEGQIPGQLTVEDMLRDGGVPEHVFQGGEFRVPYSRTSAPLSLFQNPAWKGGIPRTPGSVTHAYEGGLLKSGRFRNDTAQLVAESYMEAERFAALLRARDQIIHLASDTPDAIPAKYRQAIRLDSLRGKAFPQAVRDFLSAPEEQMAREGTLEHWQMFGNAYESMRAEIFPKSIGPEKGVKWIDKRLLGGLDKQNPLIGFASHGGVTKVMSLVDAVNNASRLAILYLKPAYAVPNLLGNAAMNMVQQGFASVPNLGRAVALAHKLGTDVHIVDATMGEGFTRSIAGHEGIGNAIVQKAANFWSRGVDLPFRRSSFIFEARAAGFKTAAEIKSLLHDPEHHERLVDVVRRANKEIIDYADLNPVERDIIRRVIFFYPWVKGSTRYAGRFISEHPTQAVEAGMLGQQGEEQVRADLGEVPSWDEGLFKVGKAASGNPLVASSSAAAIFQTPADVVRTLRESLTGNFTSAHSLASYLSPVGAAELAALSRRNRIGVDYKRSVSVPEIFARELGGGLPITTLVQRLRGKSSTSSHYTREQALLAYLLTGSLTPHEHFRAVANAQARREQKG